MPPNRAQSRARVAGVKKAGRTTKKKVRPRPGEAKVVELPTGGQEAPPPPPQQDGQFSVDPNRIQAKMRDKLANAEYQLALTEAAFEQSQDQVRALQNEVQGLQSRVTELEAEADGDEEDDEDDDDESGGRMNR